MRLTPSLAFPALPALPALLAAAVLLTGSLVPAAEVAPPAFDPAVAAGGSLDLATQKARLAASFAGQPASQVLAGLGVAAPASPASATLEEAFGRLGVPMAPGFAALPAHQQKALAALVDGVAAASALLDQAFAAMPAEDRAFLVEHVLDLEAPGAKTQEQQDDLARLEGLLALVDVDALRASGLALTRAAEASQASLAPSSAVPPIVPPPVFPPNVPNPCASTTGLNIVDSNGWIEVGFPGSNHYTQERLLILDFGGDDCYENHPASYGPGTTLPLPVSVILDVDGNDRYLANGPIGTTDRTWASGVGIGGAGLVVDLMGNDVHSVVLNGPPCPGVAYPWTLGQGVGILGVGGVVDGFGDDSYAVSFSLSGSGTCHHVLPFTAGQGVAGAAGLGFLVDGSGNDRYAVASNTLSMYYLFSRAAGQAAAFAGGAAALVDGLGSDRYNTTNAGVGGVTTGKGVMVQAFAQGTAFEDGFPPSVTLVGGGTVGGCASCVPVAAALLADLGGTDQYGVRTTATGDLGGACENLWSWANGQGAFAAEGGWRSTAAGAGALVDLASFGPDAFTLDARASGNCPESSTVGQGAASAPGSPVAGLSQVGRANLYPVSAGVLVRADCFIPDQPDPAPWSFPSIATYAMPNLATARTAALVGLACPCPPIPSLYPRVSDLDSGSISVSFATIAKSLSCLPCIPANVNTWTLQSLRDIIAGPVPPSPAPCSIPKVPPPAQGATYMANAVATNPGPAMGNAMARTTAQGASRGVFAHDGGAVGVHVDVAGADRLTAYADTNGAYTNTPSVVAQGATSDALAGVLANIGGGDAYQARARNNNVPVPANVAAQGDNAKPGTSLALFLEALGVDTYTQPCRANGTPVYRWGDFPTYVCGSTNGYILGLDITP